MLVRSGRGAADLAALLGERDPMREAGVDLGLRLEALRRGDGRFQRVRAEAKPTPPSDNIAGTKCPPPIAATDFWVTGKLFVPRVK